MAVVNYTTTDVPGGTLITWPNMANGDTGQPLHGCAAPDRSIHFSGTFGTGGTVKLRGSNTGTNYLDLTDPQGNAISKTAEAIEAVTEIAAYTRPEVTAGDVTTALTATLLIKRS